MAALYVFAGALTAATIDIKIPVYGNGYAVCQQTNEGDWLSGDSLLSVFGARDGHSVSITTREYRRSHSAGCNLINSFITQVGGSSFQSNNWDWAEIDGIGSSRFDYELGDGEGRLAVFSLNGELLAEAHFHSWVTINAGWIPINGGLQRLGNATISVVSTPEPSTWIAGLALFAVVIARRRRYGIW